MLELRTLDNQVLDLYPRTSINLTLNCPIFDRESIDRAYTFPFKIPASDHNLRFFKNINRIDARLPAQYLPILLSIGEQELIPFMHGELELIGSNDRDIDVSFKNTSLRAIEKLKTQKLRSISHIEEVTDIYNPTLVFVNIPPDVVDPPPFMIGINEHVFSAEVVDGTAFLAAQINAIFGPGVASVPTGLPEDFNEVYIQFTNIPRPFNIYIRPAAPGIGLYFDLFSSTAADEVDRINDDFAAYIASGGSTIAKYPIIKAPNLYGADKNALWGGYANYISTTNEHPNTTDNLPDPFAWKHTLLPQPLLLPVLNKVVQAAGFNAVVGSWVNDAEIQDLLLWQNSPIDLVVSDLDLIVDQPDDITPFYKHTYLTSFNLAEYLPDITADALLLALVNTWCLYLSARQGNLVITPVRKLLRSKPEDWTAIAEPYKGQIFPASRTHSLDFDRQGDDTTEPDQLLRVEGGSESQPFVSPFYTLFERTEIDQFAIRDEDPAFRSWLLPYTNEEGRSSYFSLNKAPSLRLLFWRGLQDDSEGNPYPLATHGRFGYFNLNVGNYSIDWSGTGGRYEEWWQEYIRMLTQGRTIRRMVRLSAVRIVELARWNSVIKKIIYDELGQTAAVVKSARMQISTESISMSDVEFITF